MAKSANPRKVIELWLERDLTEAAQQDQLPSVFDAEEPVGQLVSLIEAGRCPVLCGPPGVGKTSIVHAFAGRLLNSDWRPEWAKRHILQLSIERRAVTMRQGSQLATEFESLTRALTAVRDEVIPFFRDFHLIETHSLSSYVGSLPQALEGPVLGEGRTAGLQSLFEDSPELESNYVLLQVPEPSLERTRRILAAWAEEQRRAGRHFDDEALEAALVLTHRFLARDGLPRKPLNLLSQVAALVRGEQRIDAAPVMDRFCRLHGVPRMLVDSRAPLNLNALEQRFSGRVLGQKPAIDAVIRRIGMIKAGLTDVRHPFGAFLFVGPTGVGKTEIAKLLADELFGGEDRLIRVNMADFPNESSAGTLFGLPEAWGANKRGTLTQMIAGRAIAVLLLDEFEKCDAKVRDRFLQLIDEGCFINGAGETIPCRSMFIIATSNAGAEVYRGQVFGFLQAGDEAALDEAVSRRLVDHFRTELLNRFDEIVRFHPLSRETIRAIAIREFDAMSNRLGMRQRRLRLEVDEPVLDWVVVHGYDADFGARFLRRTIDRHVVTALAETVIRQEPPEGSVISLTVRGDRIIARVVEPTVAPPATEPAPTAAARASRLSGAELRAQADRTLAVAEPLLAALEQDRLECSRLIDAMSRADLWTNPHERTPVLERFRRLDVSIRARDRLAGPLHRLKQWPAESTSSRQELDRLAREVADADRALEDWQIRLAEEESAGAWLVISSLDALHAPGDWIEDLVAMQRAWARRLYLACDVAAYEVRDDALLRAVMRVEGPGALTYLAMECGLHRFWQRGKSALRAKVELLPQGPEPGEPSGEVVAVTRPRPARLGMTPAHYTRIEVAQRGLWVHLTGPEVRLLDHLRADLVAAWTKADNTEPPVARIYNEDGGRVRDPRTNAISGDLRRVLRGDLQVFLDAWLRRNPTGWRGHALDTTQVAVPHAER